MIDRNIFPLYEVWDLMIYDLFLMLISIDQPGIE